jgi:hypothetical protein
MGSAPTLQEMQFASLSLFGFSQGHTRPVAILWQEHHASGFKGRADGGDRGRLQFLAAFEAGDCIRRNAGQLCQFPDPKCSCGAGHFGLRGVHIVTLYGFS